MADSGFFTTSGASIPRTFDELCAFLLTWPDRYQDAYSRMEAMALHGSPRYMLIRQALTLYQNHIALHGGDLSFDTPLLRHLLTLAEQTAAPLPENPSANDWEDYLVPALSANETLFIRDFQGQSRDSDLVYPLFLALEDGASAPLRLDVDVLFINPYSAHQDTALRYLEAVAQELSDETRIMLCPDLNTPLPNPIYQTTLETIHAMIAQTEAQIASAGELQRRELQDQLTRQQSSLHDYEQNQPYLISDQTIAAYRRAMESAFLQQGGFRSDVREVLADITARYSDGLIDMEAFIREAEGKVRLIHTNSNL